MEKYSNYLNKRLKKVKDDISSSGRRPILFVGSGMSQRYFGAPNWVDLLKELFNVPNATKPFEYYMQEYNQDLIKVADRLVTLYRRYYWNGEVKKGSPSKLYNSKNKKDVFLKYQISKMLKNNYNNFSVEGSKYKEELNSLRKVTPQSIITTNYDTLLDDIFPKYNVLTGNDVFRSEKANSSFNIYKIHGSVNNYQDIVIDSDDYKRFNDTQLYLVSKMITYFIEYPIIFIGYSLNDADVQKILRSINKVRQEQGSSPILSNMWFVEWSPSIDNEDATPDIKYISLGGGESVGVNYLRLTDFTPLYKAIYQDTVDVDALKVMEHTVYDIVKSASITNLKVDVANIEYMDHPKEFLNILTKKNAFVKLAAMTDPEQLASIYVYTPTQIAKKVMGNSGNWQSLYRLIDDTEEQIGVNIRKTNNVYHVDLTGVSRFSEKAVGLLEKIRKGEKVILDPQKIEKEFHLTP